MDTSKYLILITILIIIFVLIFLKRNKVIEKQEQFIVPNKYHSLDYKEINNNELIKIIKCNQYKEKEDKTYLAHNENDYYENKISKKELDKSSYTLEHIDKDPDFNKNNSYIDLNQNKKNLWKKLNDVARPWYIY